MEVPTIKLIIKAVIFVILAVVIFRTGYAVGINRGKYKTIGKEFSAVKKMLGDQNNISKELPAGLNTVRIKGYKKIKKQAISVWMPSILITINIFLTLLLVKSRK